MCISLIAMPLILIVLDAFEYFYSHFLVVVVAFSRLRWYKNFLNEEKRCVRSSLVVVKFRVNIQPELHTSLVIV